jgi:hypothetical protein
VTAEEQGYDLQRVYAEKVGGPFRFKWADRWWTMPNMRSLDFEAQDRIENLDAAAATKDSLNELFDDLLGKEQGPAWRDVDRPIEMILDMFNAWLEHSKAKLGESPASAGSSKSTGRPSSRTSNASTGSASAKPSKPRKRAAVPRGNSSPTSTA